MNSISTELKVADEAFLATALLHREHPERLDFTISEIVERAAQENLHGELRPGVRVHVTLHCVANLAPNSANLRMLYATGKRTRRLLLSSDDVHPGRTGKIFPNPEDVPREYRELIEWAKRRYSKENLPQPPRSRWLGGLFQLFGLGRDLWRGEDPDEYVRKLREGWE